MARIRWFLIISGILLLTIFSLSNTNSVPIQMPLVFSTEIPLSMLLAISGLIGFMVGALWTAWMLRRRGGTDRGGTGPNTSGGEVPGKGQAPPE